MLVWSGWLTSMIVVVEKSQQLSDLRVIVKDLSETDAEQCVLQLE